MRAFFHRDFLCIGHRGAPASAPENTLAGFASAIDQGVDAIEFDVQLVASTLVVIHDDTLDRTTSGSGAVATASLEHLRSLDAGRGERIPLLDEVLDLAAGRVGVNIELKGPGTAGPVVDLLRHRRERPEAFLLSAFDHGELEVARSAGPEFPRGALFGRRDRDPVATGLALGARSINLHRRGVRPAIVEAARAAGLATLVYTVNTPDEALALQRMGASGVFTDAPDQILAVLPGRH